MPSTLTPPAKQLQLDDPDDEDDEDGVDVVFTYAELSDDAKKVAREREDYSTWVYEDAVETLRCEMDNRGMQNLAVHHALAFCQGDGVGFSGRIDASDIEDPEFLPLLVQQETFHFAGRTFTYRRLIADAAIDIEEAHHQYSPDCFNVTATVMVPDPDGDEGIDFIESDDEALNESFTKAVQGYFDKLARQLYGEATHYMLSDLDDECVVQFFEEHRFDEDGHFHDYVYNLE